MKFLEEMLLKVKDDYFMNQNLLQGNIFVILDNASYHQSTEIKDFARKNNVNLIYNFPYKPE